MVRGMEVGEHAFCERILRALPDWFGIETAIVDYVQDIQSMETWVAESDDGIVGFLTVNQHNAHSAEIQIMAMAEAQHGRGCGGRLIGHVETVLRGRSVEFTQVKTLAPARESTHYEKTRGFYEHMGFKPLEENNLWGEKNPCLIMVKHLSCKERTSQIPHTK